MTVLTTQPHDTGTHAPSLISDEEFQAVVATIRRDHPNLDGDEAGRILAGALTFVADAARDPEHPQRPSRTVDVGWHALILHTAVYAGLCGRLGRFVHHYPKADGGDDEGPCCSWCEPKPQPKPDSK